jgi:hypothetical protein
MHLQRANIVPYSSIMGDASLSPIASMDSNGAAVMLISTGGGNVSVTMNNLPAAFSGGSFTFHEYLIDPTHSNYPFSTTNGGQLQTVQTVNKPAASSFSTTLSLAAQSIVLVELTSP